MNEPASSSGDFRPPLAESGFEPRLPRPAETARDAASASGFEPMLPRAKPDFRRRIAELIARWQPAAAPATGTAPAAPADALRELLRRGGLGRTAKADFAVLLTDMLERGDESERSEAAEFVGGFGLLDADRPAAVVIALARELLRAGDAAAAEAAVSLVGRSGPEAAAAVPDLIEMLREGTPEIAVRSAEALGRIGEPAALAAEDLARLARRPEPALRRAAARALRRITARAPQTDED
jgi:hypothetical protein